MAEQILFVWGKTCFSFDKCNVDTDSLRKSASRLLGIDEESLYLTYNGKCLDEDSQLKDELSIVQCNCRLAGGKGGFGSMLRAMGAQIEKTTNREACRDLSGRRMRDVNNEKKIGEWLEKEKKNEEEKAKKKKEKLERILNPPRHMLKDSSYINEVKETAEKVSDALRQGLQKTTGDQMETSSQRKREHLGKQEKVSAAKKRRAWLDIHEFEEDLSSSEGEHESVEDERISVEILASPVEQSKSCDVTCAKIGTAEEQSPVKVEAGAEIAGKITDGLSSKQESQNIAELGEEQTRKSTEEKKDNPEDEGASCSNDDDKKAGVTQAENDNDSIDLHALSSAEELEAFGLEKLKNELIRHGLKCGGTLQQRAQRLFLLKDTPIDQLDASVFAKAGKKNKKGQQL
eukprot:gene19847-21788_t